MFINYWRSTDTGNTIRFHVEWALMKQNTIGFINIRLNS